MSELNQLRGLGDQITPPPIAALRETAHRRSRQRTVVAAVSAAAVAAVVLGVAALTMDPDEGRETPIEPPDVAPTSHPLTYADGPTVHYGDRTVTAPDPVVELDVTDDGVVLRTDAGGIWFTDGTDLEQLGTLGQPGPEYDEPDYPYGATWGFVVSGNTGSHVAWLEFPVAGRPEIVAYDAGAGAQVIRSRLDVDPGSYALLASVTERFAYWYTTPEFEDDATPPQARIELSSGKQSSVSWRDYVADRPDVGTPRTMMVSHAQGDEPVTYVVFDGTAWQFDVTRNRVEPQGGQSLDARDGGTNKPFVFTKPAGYPQAAPNWLTQWLDDDTVVVTVNRAGNDDLLECHFTTGVCTLALRLPERVVVPEIG
jgi:hypothetical protein